MFGLPQGGKGAEVAEIELMLCLPAAESKVPPAYETGVALVLLSRQ